MLLALLAALTLEQTPQSWLFRQPNLASNSSSFGLATQASFVAGGAMPTCLGDAHCVAGCFNSTGTTWVCQDNTGASVGSVSQGTSPLAEGTFWGGLARSQISDSSAATATGSVFDNLFGGDLTVIAAGIWHANGGTGNESFFSMSDVAINNTLSGNVSSGNFSCQFGENGAFPTASSTAAPLEGWAVVSCRRAGNNRIARVNGTDSATVSTAGTRVTTTGSTTSFGRERPGAAGRNLNGPEAWVFFYSESKSTTWLTTAENGFWGSVGDVGAGSSGLLGIPDDAGMNVDFFANGSHIVQAGIGLRTVGESGNNIQGNWAADPMDVSSWVDVATPIITTNVMSGPFSRYKQGPECDRIVDDNGAAFEGKQSLELQRATSAGGAHGWNVRVWAAAGDAGTTQTKMRIALLTDGGFFPDGGNEFDCDFSGLGATPAAYDCLTSTHFLGDGGIPATVKGRVLVGNAAADQGSITVCHAQETPHYFPELAVANNTSFGSTDDQVSPSGWPSTAKKGKYEIVFTPLWDMNLQWDNTAGTIYLFDASDATPQHDQVNILGYTAAGLLMGRTGHDGGLTEFHVLGQSTIALHRYALSMEWVPTGGGFCKVTFRFNSCAGSASTCFATTSVASLTDGTGLCPDQPTKVGLGNRFDNTVPTSVFIDAVRVYQ